MTPQPPKPGKGSAATTTKPAEKQGDEQQVPNIDWNAFKQSMDAIQENQKTALEQTSKVNQRLEALENAATTPAPAPEKQPVVEATVNQEQVDKAAEKAIEAQADKAAGEVKSLPGKMIGGLWSGVKWMAEPLKPRVPTKEGVRNAVVLEVVTLGAARYIPPVRYAVINIITP